MTYLIPSWITAFGSKHPNMHRSSTRDEIGLRHPISRGLLPRCRGAACARVWFHACELKRDCKHTCLYVFIDIYLLTPLSARFIFKRTALSSPRPHVRSFLSFFFFFLPSSPSLCLLCSPPIHPSSKHLPAIPFHSSTHLSVCICYPQGRQFPASHQGGKTSDLIFHPFVWCVERLKLRARGWKVKERESEAEGVRDILGGRSGRMENTAQWPELIAAVWYFQKPQTQCCWNVLTLV